MVYTKKCTDPLKEASSWTSKEGGPPTQYEWMRANYAYQGARSNRAQVWADMQKLSKNKTQYNLSIWDYDIWYASRDVTLGACRTNNSINY